METNTDPIDPLSVNVTALATQLESKYTAFRNRFSELYPRKIYLNFKI